MLVYCIDIYKKHTRELFYSVKFLDYQYAIDFMNTILGSNDTIFIHYYRAIYSLKSKEFGEYYNGFGPVRA